MSLPVAPDVETILDSCIETLRDVVVPSVEGEWPRYSAELMVGSLEYAKCLLQADYNESRREELRLALVEVKKVAADSDNPVWEEALAADSPFVAASQVLVTCQNVGDDMAGKIRAVLHPVLRAQLDAEFGRTLGLFAAFARNMAGSK